jgi:glucose-1-phosphate adenylyltransferase
MDLLAQPDLLNLNEIKWPIFTTYLNHLTQDEVRLDNAKKTLIGEGCSILGNVEEAVLFSGVHICSDATVREAVIMPGACIGPGSYIERAIIGPGAVIAAGCKVCGGDNGIVPLAIIGENNVLTSELFLN